MKRIWKRLLLGLLLAGLLGAVGYVYFGARPITRDIEQSEIKYLIGMSQANLIEPWRITMNQDIERAAKNHSDMRVIFTNASRETITGAVDQKKSQIDDVRMLMGYGIDLLIISPNDTEDLRPVIQEVYQKIPVIVLDRDVTGEAYTLFIGPNNYLIGQLAGTEVVKLLGQGGGNVVELQGAFGSPPVAARSQGFHDAIEGHEVTIIKSLSADWMQDQAEDRMKEYLVQEQPKVDAVFAQNDAMAYGAYIATEKLRVPGIRFVGVDGLKGYGGGEDMVRDGVLSATFYCPTGGEQAIEYALRILSGEKDLPHRLILDPKEITKETLA